MITVFPALATDAAWVAPMLEEFSDVFGGRYPLWNAGYVADVLPAWLADNERTPFLCAFDEQRGSPRRGVGFIGGTLGPHPYNPDVIVLSEMFWWVAPRDRGSPAASLLLERFVAYGKQVAHWVTFNLNTSTPIRGANLERLGFRHVEQSYLLEVIR